MTEFLAAAIRIATPLMFAALGGILSERAGVFAVGLEGMMLAGAFAAVVGAWASGDAGAGVLLATGRQARRSGSWWRWWPCAIRADNMVTGLTANILALGLTSYLLRVLAGGGRPVAIHLTPLAALADPWPRRSPGARPAALRAAAAHLSRGARLRRARRCSSAAPRPG